MFASIAKHFRKSAPTADQMPVLSRAEMANKIESLTGSIEARGLSVPPAVELPGSSLLPPARSVLEGRIEQLEGVLGGKPASSTSESASAVNPPKVTLSQPREAMAERIKGLEQKLKAANVAIPPPVDGMENRAAMATRLAELEDLSSMADQLEAKEERLIQLREEKARLDAEVARRHIARAGGSPAREVTHKTLPSAERQWTVEARAAEALRLLELDRDSTEVQRIITLASDPVKGQEARQKLVDCVAALPVTKQFGLRARFHEAFKAVDTLGPRQATAQPPPPVHRDAMTAGQLLAMSPEAQASLADLALRMDHGRAARVEIKRAHTAASPAQQAAMQGPFGKVLSAHKDEPI